MKRALSDARKPEHRDTKKHNIKKILTHCPHCLNTIKNEYPQFGGEFEVIHHSEFISNLIKEGKIRLQKELNSVATYHDSCYLGRYNDIYNPPRSILNAISGIKLKEMDRTMDKSFCCGAGGGHMWMEVNIGKKINHMRIEQATEGSILILLPLPVHSVL